MSIRDWFRKKKVEPIIIDALPPVKTKQSTMAIAKIPPVKDKSLLYSNALGFGSGRFITPEYNLTEVLVIEDTDSYVKRAFSKKLGLMFKEGFDFIGPNPDTLTYLKTRLLQISRASAIPHIELLKRTASSLIRTSNAFLIKVRDVKASGGGPRVDPTGKRLLPVAGYFPAAPETMSVRLNKSGKIVKWKQEIPGGEEKEFSPEDVIHFIIDKREGYIFGVPSIVPVIDDIRALRQMEEHVELLVYQHLFPLYHWQVGSDLHPADIMEDGTREIDYARQQVENLPSEGSIVTDHRQQINAIGAEGRALRADPYLEHFKRRVIAGLGISLVDLGEGDSANRATSQVMSRALVDSVKSFQDALEAQWNQHVVSELLLESTFSLDVLAGENMVYLQFAEIDIQNKIEQEEHNVELFKNNGLTYNEFRGTLGREPINIPEDPNDQDPSKYPEWSNTYWKIFGEPAALIAAVDEPYSVAAQTAVANRSLSATQKELDQSAKATAQAEKEKAQLKTQARPTPVKKKDSVANKMRYDSISGSLKDLSSDIKIFLQRGESLSRVNQQIYAWAEMFNKYLERSMLDSFSETFGIQRVHPIYLAGKAEIQHQSLNYTVRLSRRIITLLKQRLDLSSSSVTIEAEKVDLLFSVVSRQVAITFGTLTQRSRNYGAVLSLRVKGLQSLVTTESTGDALDCDRCISASQSGLPLEAVSFLDLPPFHPNCRCKSKFVNQNGSSDNA